MPETNRARGYRGHEVRAPIASVLAASTLLLAVVLSACGERRAAGSEQDREQILAVMSSALVAWNSDHARQLCSLLTAHGRERVLRLPVDFDWRGTIIGPNDPRGARRCESLVLRAWRHIRFRGVGHEEGWVIDTLRSRFTVLSVTGRKAEVRMSERTGAVLHFSLRKTASVWRIDDVSSRGLKLHSRSATAAPRRASPDVSPTGSALPDKAGGGRRPSGATLTLTNPSAGTGDVDEFTHAVSRLSHGRMRVSVSEFAYYMQLDRANSLVRDLQAGRVQLAKIDTRELDRAGVSALRALTAPGLIDSLALEQRVLESAISRQMLSSFRRLGLVGLAIVPGELFKPVGITRTLLAPRDFRGATFYVTPSDVDTATLRALGARPIAHVYETIKQVDGLETSVHPFYFAHSVHHGRVTSATNLNLWPRLSAIFMSARVFDRLPPDQQRVLRTAGARLVASAIARVRSQTAESTRVACARGVRLMRARAADVAAFKRALRPVLASLDRDAQTRRFISAIARMKQQLGTGPDAQSCGKPAPRPPVSTRPTPIDGVYRSDVTVAQLNRVPSFEAREYGLAEFGHFTLVLRRGRFRWSGASVHGDLPISGTFALHGPVVTLRPVDPIDFAGYTWTYRWSRYRDILSFRKVGRAPVLLVVHPWRRASP